MKKILPFKVPEVTCHPDTAAVFGILESLNLGKEWIYTNFIMTDAFVLQGDMYHNHLDLVLEPGYDSASVCPWIDRSEIREDILKALTEDNIITILKNLILADNYIYVTVEESIFFQNFANFMTKFKIMAVINFYILSTTQKRFHQWRFRI